MNGQRACSVFLMVLVYAFLCALLLFSRALLSVEAQTVTPEPSPQVTDSPPPPNGVTAITLTGELYEGLGESACFKSVSYGGRDDSAELELDLTVVPEPQTTTCTVSREVQRYTQSDPSLYTIFYPRYSCELRYRSAITQADITFEPPGMVGDPPQPYQKIIVPETDDLSVNCPVADSNRDLSLDFTLPGQRMTFDGDAVEVSADLIFTHTVPWIKLKNASYAGLGNRYNSIPWNVTRFDPDDDQLVNNGRVFSTGINSGVATTYTTPQSPDPTPFHTGAGFFVQKRIDRNGAIAKHWSNEDYSMSQYHARSLFFDYVRSRKQYTQIGAVDELATTLNENGIYRMGTEAEPVDLTLTDSNISVFNDKHILLYVTGKVTIDTSLFQPTDGHTIFLAPEIEIGPSAQDIRGILISHVISITSTDQLEDRGLKIVGNLVATQYFVNNRQVADNSVPSLFISYDPTPYIELLPFLSTSEYDWTYDE